MIWPLMENRWDWHGGDEALFSFAGAIFLLGDAIIKHRVILSDFNHEPGYLSPSVTLLGQVRLTVKYGLSQPNPPCTGEDRAFLWSRGKSKQLYESVAIFLCVNIFLKKYIGQK